MYIKGIKIISLSIVDLIGNWRTLGNPEFFQDALTQLKTVQKLGVKQASINIVFWQDDKRLRKNPILRTEIIKGSIAEIITQVKAGNTLEKHQLKMSRAA